MAAVLVTSTVPEPFNVALVPVVTSVAPGVKVPLTAMVPPLATVKLRVLDIVPEIVRP